MRYGIAVTADTILSTVEISSTAIGAYIILLQEDSTYIIAAVVLMTSFVATTFKHIFSILFSHARRCVVNVCVKCFSPDMPSPSSVNFP